MAGQVLVIVLVILIFTEWFESGFLYVFDNGCRIGSRNFRNNKTFFSNLDDRTIKLIF